MVQLAHFCFRFIMLIYKMKWEIMTLIKTITDCVHSDAPKRVFIFTSLHLCSSLYPNLANLSISHLPLVCDSKLHPSANHKHFNAVFHVWNYVLMWVLTGFNQLKFKYVVVEMWLVKTHQMPHLNITFQMWSNT